MKAKTRSGLNIAAIATVLFMQPVLAQSTAGPDIQDGIDEMVQMLRDEGIAIDAAMDAASADCQQRFGSGTLPATATSSEQAVRDCTVVAHQVVYSAAINELHETRQARFRAKLAEHEALVAQAQRQLNEHESQIAASEAQAEREMAQWREAVRRCEQGQRRYCAKEPG